MKPRPVILIVDDSIFNIEIMAAFLGADYETCFAMSGEDAIEVAGEIRPDLILLDVVMTGIDGYETCRLLKADATLADVPVIFTTGRGTPEDEARGFQAGAVDYVNKPIQPTTLRQRVERHLARPDEGQTAGTRSSSAAG